MLIPIDKIIVKDRIRKDFGDIESLADSIRKYGLINPPTINKNNVLLAGERRVRACKLLGWTEIPVNMKDTDDEETDFGIQVDENEERKEFSRAERAEIMKRELETQQKKAEERKLTGKAIDHTPNSAEGGEARNITAKMFGIGRDTMKKEIEISDKKALLDPVDFADWDEGKLSTNRTYQRLKARLRELENREPEVIEKVVAPDDYKALKKKAREADAWKTDYHNQQVKTGEAQRKILELQDQIKELQKQTVREQLNNDFIAGALYFIAQCGNFIKDVAGYVWIADKLADLPEKDRVGYIKAAKTVQDWATALLQTIERDEQYGRPELLRLGR